MYGLGRLADLVSDKLSLDGLKKKFLLQKIFILQ